MLDSHRPGPRFRRDIAAGEADVSDFGVGRHTLRLEVRLPERMRWMVEKVVHDPEAPPAPKPELPDSIRDRLVSLLAEDVAALRRFAGREFAGWKSYS